MRTGNFHSPNLQLPVSPWFSHGSLLSWLIGMMSFSQHRNKLLIRTCTKVIPLWKNHQNSSSQGVNSFIIKVTCIWILGMFHIRPNPCKRWKKNQLELIWGITFHLPFFTLYLIIVVVFGYDIIYRLSQPVLTYKFHSAWQIQLPDPCTKII